MRRKWLLAVLLPWLLLNVVCILSYVGNPLVASITVIYSYDGAENDTEYGSVIRSGGAGTPDQKSDLQITFSVEKPAPRILVPPSPGKVNQSSVSSSDKPIMEQTHRISNTGASHTHFPINQVDMCQNGMFLLIIVCSAVENSERRTAIRETWGSVANKGDSAAHGVGLLFLLGKQNDSLVKHSTIDYTTQSETPKLQDKIQIESELHSDILQADFVDSYQNLSIKSVYMLKWMSEFCPTAKFALKTDDDMFVNVPNLLGDLNNSVHKRFIMGHIIAAAQPMRRRTSKWYTSVSVFNGTWYPTYISGSAYVFSGDLIKDLYNATQNVKMFWLEDVYITGLCAKRINAMHVYNGKFGYLKRQSNPCVFKHVITGHRMTPTELYKMWGYLRNKDIKCDYTKISLLHRF